MTAIELVAERPDFVVVAKPAGLSFHAEDGAPGLVGLMREQCVGELFPVHRLDRITSGLVLLARSAAAAARFGALFASGAMEKYYLALADRKPSKSQGLIAGTMEKGRNGSWRLGRPDAAGGALARSQFFSYGVVPGRRLFVLRPRNGRTHQLRVALKSLGSPIFGDARYGGSEATRGYLHAWALRFVWQGTHEEFLLPPTDGEFALPEVQAKIATLTPPWRLAWPLLTDAASAAGIAPPVENER